MRKTTVAATQMECREHGNLDAAEAIVRAAAKAGANIILLQELFETKYFCQKQDDKYRSLATAAAKNPAVARFSSVARELGAVLPISFFERSNNAFFNSLAIIDADGSVLGIYRKSHIPDGAGYCEKFFFCPGDTGFKVWDTAYGRIGCGICWDQWFPEAARIMALKGAELLLYPTAIGSEPEDPDMDSRSHWRACMCGHAAANLVPVAASNRVGLEREGGSEITFYGSSFIADGQGQLAGCMDGCTEGFVMAEFDLDALQAARAAWGVFRDRRPELYGGILTLDGKCPSPPPRFTTV
jgi:N-carbamoylputrescine amidase